MDTKIWNNLSKGQVAAVTGGADGLGFAIAQRLAAGGATVWLLDRGAARLQQAVSRVTGLWRRRRHRRRGVREGRV